MGEEFEDAASLVDAAFGAARAEDAEPADSAEPDEKTAGADESAVEVAEASDADAEAIADADKTAVAEPTQDVGAKRKLRKGKASAALAAADAPEAESSGELAETAATDGSAAESVELSGETAEAVAGAEPETAPGASTEPTEPTPDSPTADAEPAARKPLPTFSLTRGRVAAAAAVVLGVAAASVLVLSGGGSGNAATPGGIPSTLPSVNPQAFYPMQSAPAYSTGGKSELTDAELLAAVPGCGGCKLVTRANGFSPDGAVLALFRTGAPQVGKGNFKLVVVGADGKSVWSAPDGVKALTAGIERFSTDAAGNFYLALPGAKSGQVLIVLAWRDGKVQDLGGLLDPKVKSDSIVGVLPGAVGATATIVSQTTVGVPDADTGGLVESQYQIKDGKPVLVGCRRHVGESGQWIAFQPSADGCTHWPDGPVGPPDDDDERTAPGPAPTTTS